MTGNELQCVFQGVANALVDSCLSGTEESKGNDAIFNPKFYSHVQSEGFVTTNVSLTLRLFNWTRNVSDYIKSMIVCVCPHVRSV